MSEEKKSPLEDVWAAVARFFAPCRDAGNGLKTAFKNLITWSWSGLNHMVDLLVYVVIVVLVFAALLAVGAPPLVDLLNGEPVADVVGEARPVSADDVLNFLQGASVLIGGAVAVAAIYGFRNAQEVRKELRDEQERLKHSGEKLREREERLAQELQEAHDIVATLQMNTAELSEAYHNLLQRNYQQAFDLAQSILQRDPENITALYLSGWLSIQFLEDRTVDQAISDLEKALQLAKKQAAEPRLPAIKAALGVAYRRKGKRQKEVRERCFAKSEYYLLEVTENRKTERLLDLYGESFHAPLGGLYRDRGQLDKAIQHYRRATEITPGSSYPWGNWAQLLWEKGEIEEAQVAFERAHRTALREQGATPEDYYLLMDLAMSGTVLKKFDEAKEWLEEALGASLTTEMLRTSLQGWKWLYKSCPRDENWQKVRIQLCENWKRVRITIRKNETQSS